MKTKFPVTRKNFKNDNNLDFDLTLEILDLMGWNMENCFFQIVKSGEIPGSTYGSPGMTFL